MRNTFAPVACAMFYAAPRPSSVSPSGEPASPKGSSCTGLLGAQKTPGARGGLRIRGVFLSGGHALVDFFHFFQDLGQAEGLDFFAGGLAQAAAQGWVFPQGADGGGDGGGI